MKILIVEDEQPLVESIVSYLDNYVCETAADYTAAIKKTETFDYDCIILDITLPGGSGLNVLENLKANGKSDGVLIISARNSLDDRVRGLNLGADDYLSKPFHLSELSARIASIIRRKNFEGSTLIHFNGITVDTAAREVKFNHVPIELTRKEYELLLYFLANRNRVISKTAIAQHLWGDEMDLSDNFDFIYTHIKNLRRKLADPGKNDLIKSVYGMGYKLS